MAQEAPQEPGQEPEQTPAQTEQEPKTFDADYVKKLRDEAASNRTKANSLEQRLKEFEDRDKTQAQKDADKKAELESRAIAAEQKLLRFEVAAEKGLDAKYADLLTGSTKEEMAARADLLLDAVTPTGTSFDGGVREPATTGDMNSLIRTAARRGT